MTALEFLLSKTAKHCFNQQEIEQAKEMEKQQIIDAISNANKSNNRNVSLNPEQYYNETYNLSQQDKP